MGTALIGKIISSYALTVILTKVIKVAGKNDYAEMIKLSGYSIVGIHVAKYVADFVKNNKTGLGFFKKAIDTGIWLLSDMSKPAPWSEK